MTTTNAVASDQLTMPDCPRYDTCSAPICPLDPLWRKRRHQKSEPTCFYFREAGKEGAEKRFSGRADRAIYLRAVEVRPLIETAHGDLWKRLQEAALTPSTADRGEKVQAKQPSRPSATERTRD